MWYGAEEPLPAYGACLLGSLNLSAFVNDGNFDYLDFIEAVKIAIGALNEVLDEGIEAHPLKRQRDCCRDWRQCGLGIMGLADCLIKLGLTYGSQESLDFCDDIGKKMAYSALVASANLAKEKGSYPKFDSKIMQSSFFRTHTDGELIEYANHYGLRNSQLLTIAPTGTISTMLGISGGIEPIFANSYTRTTKSLHDKDVEYKVYAPIVKKYMEDNNLIDENQLPDYFITSEEILVEERVAMQSIWQSHIDASISSTVNLPESATVDDVKKIYMLAWEKGLKGITIFRSGCARTAILNTKPKKENNRGEIISVPENLTYKKYKLFTGCGKLYLFIGLDKDGKIYDIFTNTDGRGGCTINTQANSRLISMCLRSGVSVETIINQLESAGSCPSYQYAKGKGKELSKGKSCPSAIANVLKELIGNPQKDKEEKCPECGSNLIHENGCKVCKICGWSKCN